MPVFEAHEGKRLAGKTVVVTGATAGIGRFTAERLAAQGATVILACRKLDAAGKAAAEIRQKHAGAMVVVGPQLDLMSEDSIRSFAHEYKKRQWSLSILVNNAGTNYLQKSITKTGIGGLCQVNYLGPYLLTRLLEPCLIQSAPSKVVNLSSVTHRYGCIPDVAAFLHDWAAGDYPHTKLGNVLFTFESQRRLGQHGVQCCAIDPGGVYSNIWQGSSVFAKGPGAWVIGALYAPPWDGCASTVEACLQTEQTPLPACGFAKGSVADKERQGCKVYARGLFASRFMSSVNYKPPAERSLFDHVAIATWAGGAVLLSLLDWPLRHISGGRINNQTYQVPAAPAAYDTQLAAKLWDASADVCKVPREPMST